MKLSFLFGAGFSRPAGYPLASELSNKILRVQASGIRTESSGDAWLRPEFIAHLENTPDEPFTEPQDMGNVYNRPGTLALEAVLKVYGLSHDLTDYEAFYDELYRYYRHDANKLDDPAFVAAYRERNLHNDPVRQGESRHIDQALSTAFKIFPQLLVQLLRADRRAASSGAGDAYQRFFSLLRTHTRRRYGAFWDTPVQPHTFYLHTLNHDLLVENWLDDEDVQESITYCDGFSEMGSQYFGRLDFGSDFPRWMQGKPQHANVRMPRYTDVFSGSVQLFKLHGSLDYYSFGVEGSDTGLYEPLVVKKQPWLNHIHLLREVEVNGELRYRNDFTNYHPLFLSGTTAKLEQYADPVLFSKLLRHFEQNLIKSDVLVIIGYGFRDEGINEFILPFLQDSSKKVIVIGRDLPLHFPAVRPDMFHSGGLEAYDFSELELLLATPSQE